MLKSLIVASLTAISLISPAFALLPPAGIAYHQLVASIGADPCVKVGEPDSFTGNATVTPIQVCDAAKAQALADVLQPNAKYLGTLRITDPNGNVIQPAKISGFTQLAQAADTALRGNPYYSKSYPYDALGFTPNCALVEFKPQVIEVATDNISNPYGSNSYVAADVFVLFLNPDAGGVNDGLRPATGPNH